MSYADRFHANPGINPETGRSIKIDGPTYKKLVRKYGLPPSSLASSSTIVVPPSITKKFTFTFNSGTGSSSQQFSTQPSVLTDQLILSLMMQMDMLAIRDMMATIPRYKSFSLGNSQVLLRHLANKYRLNYISGMVFEELMEQYERYYYTSDCLQRKSLNECMVMAAEGGNKLGIHKMLQAGATNFASAMEAAARNGHWDIVKIMLQHGISTWRNQLDVVVRSAYQEAMMAAIRAGNYDIVKLLYETMDQNQLNIPIDYDRATRLANLSNASITQLLTENSR